jgi:uncharacterized protein YbjT (DUF2867 family)
MENQRILLLGSTGRTGKYLLKETLEKGYEVNVLVRDKSKIEINSNKLKIFEGDASNIKDLERSFLGCKIVISALNISRTSDFPWAKLRTPKDYLEQTVQNLIHLNKTNKIDLIMIISAWGVGDTKKDLPFWFRWLIDLSNFRFGYLGHEKQEKLLIASGINHSIIRPVGLTNFETLKPIIITIDHLPRPNILISRKNVAQYMVALLKQKKYFNQAITISEK